MQQLIRSCMLLFIAMILGFDMNAQDSIGAVLSKNFLSKVDVRTAKLQAALDKSAVKALEKLQKQEERLKRRLYRRDSIKAKEIFGTVHESYQAVHRQLNNPASLTQYIPYLDTLKTSLKFLQANPGLFSNVKDAEKQLHTAMQSMKGLESSFSGAEVVKQFLKQRKEYLKSNLSGIPLGSTLKKVNKQAYYYGARVNEYKQALQDPKKLERKAIALLSSTKPFQEFMRKNSQLATLFRLPGNDDLAAEGALQGLQTRASVNNIIQDRIGNSAEAQTLFQQNVQDAQAQLSALKAKASQYTNGSFGNGGDNMEMPDFKPNTQKSKQLLKRLEYGGNLQSQRARQFFPVTTDIGLSLGYKLNDKSVVGVGASYKLGLGKGWQSIALSHQGVGLRSFIDVKLKGSIFLSGGYEQNYRTAFTSVGALKNYAAWQSSGLIGLSKKYSISSKMKGNVQVLWDFLSYQQVPQPQAILFRAGYSLK